MDNVSAAYISVGSEYTFNSGESQLISSCPINETDFLVAYMDGSTTDDGVVIVGRVNPNGSISYGTPVIFCVDIGVGLSTDVCIVNSTSNRFFVVYADDAQADDGYIYTSTFSELVIDTGSDATLEFCTNDSEHFTICKIRDDHAVVFWNDETDSDEGKVVVVYWDSGLNAGTVVDVSDGGDPVDFKPFYTESAQISTDKFSLLFHAEDGDDIYEIAGSVSGTTISMGAYSSELYSSSLSTRGCIDSFKDDKAVIVSMEATESYFYSMEYLSDVGTIDMEDTCGGIHESDRAVHGVLLDEDTFVFAYADENDGDKGKLSFLNISWDESVMIDSGSTTFNDAVTSGVAADIGISVSRLNGTHWIVAFQDDATSDYGKVVLCNRPVERLMPEIDDVYPANGSTGIPTAPTVQVKPWDNSTVPESLTVKWYEKDSDTKNFGCEGTTNNNDLLLSNYISGYKRWFRWFEIEIEDYGTISSAKVYVKSSDSHNSVYGGIYNSYGFLVQRSNYVTTSNTNYAWKTVIFSPVVVVEPGTYYLAIFATCSGVSQTTYINENSASSTSYYSDDGLIQDWPNFPNKLPPQDGTDGELSAYTTLVVDYALAQTNNSVTSGNTVEWDYTNASSASTKYWWKVCVNNSQKTNCSISYNFTTASATNAPTQSAQKIWDSTTSVEKNLNATGVVLTPTCFNVTIADTNGDYMNVSIMTNESGSWTEVNSTSSGMTDGTFHGYNTSWVDAYSTTYYISFNVSDDSLWCNETYKFTTKASNTAPTVDYKTPVNGTTGVAFSGGVTCYAYTNDTDGDTLNITWATNESGSWINKYTNTSEPANGTESYTFTDFDTGSTKYWWKVYVDDGTVNISEVYHFTTTIFIWIDITNSSWDLGNIVMSSSTWTNETGKTFIADKDNCTVTTDLKLQITGDGADWTATTTGNAPTTDTYRLNASIDTWLAEFQIVTASPATISSDIAADQNETFDTRFDAPTATTSGNQQSITVTATLVQH